MLRDVRSNKNLRAKWLLYFQSALLSFLFASPLLATEVSQYVANFVRYSQQFSQIVSLEKLERAQVSVRFERMESWKHGYCRENDGAMEVVLNSSVWDRLEEPKQEMLVYHELGHCVLGREHSDALTQVGWEYYPLSLMHAYAVSEIPVELFELKRENYLAELFGRSSNQPFIAYVRESIWGQEIALAWDWLASFWSQR